MASLFPDYRLFTNEVNKLQSLSSNTTSLALPYQKLVAEITFLRLFGLLETYLASICMKLACGVPYLDGTKPLLLKKANTIMQAGSLFKTYGRNKTRPLSPWTHAKSIKKNVRYVIAPSDNIIKKLNIYSQKINEIRRIRNRIAHNNTTSRKKYREVVRMHYGAYLNHITPGILLLTPRKSPRLLDQYTIQLLIITKDLVRA